ncbi:MAG: PhnD/SsuA/transferrin family substrate-binding protein [Planctomycetota bacterium]
MKNLFPTSAGLVLSALGIAGCSQTSFSQSIWNPFHLELNFDVTQQPVRIGIVSPPEGPLALKNWFVVRQAPPYAGFRNALARHLGCGIQIQELEPFQITAHLQSGRLQYALVSDADYKTMTAYGPVGETLASAVPLTRCGLIVASAKSNIQSLSGIKGRRFAFGPKDDPILDQAALKTLEEAGINKDDIEKELIPNPLYPSLDRRQYHTSSLEAAKEIVYGLGTEVGVIEESDYRSFPDTGGRLLPLKFAKDNFRVLGTTATLQSETSLAGRFIASAQAHPEVTRSVVEFLSKAHTAHRNALADVGLARFEVAAAANPSGPTVAHSTTKPK